MRPTHIKKERKKTKASVKRTKQQCELEKSLRRLARQCKLGPKATRLYIARMLALDDATRVTERHVSELLACRRG